MKRTAQGRLKKITSVLLIVGLILANGPLSFAVEDNISKTQAEWIAERQKLQEELNRLYKEIEESKSEMEQSKQRASTLQTRRTIVYNQIAAIQESIALKKQQISLAQAELDKKQLQFDETYDGFKARVRAMYMNNPATALSTVLGATSFSDFLLRADYLNRIAEHDKQMMRSIATEQAEIEAAQTVLDEELRFLEQDEIALQEKQLELAALLREENNTLSAATALMEARESEVAMILESRKAIEAELSAIIQNGGDELYVGGYYAWPVPGFTVKSSPFGWRTLYGQRNYHTGLDIAGGGIFGATIIASNAGRVVRVRYSTTGYGYHVMIDHGGNNWTVYGHLSSINVVEGEWVSQGAGIGAVGSTGNSTGPHLHFEIRIDGTPVDPELYL